MSTIVLPKLNANFETALSAQMSAAATTLTLDRSTDMDSTTLSGVYELTIDEGTSSEEHMYVTMTGSSGTVSRRGLSKVDAWTEVAGNKYLHVRGATVKITNLSLVLINRLLKGEETFNAPDWLGVNSISGLATPTSGETNKAANVGYVNAVSIAGASDASTVGKGIVEEATSAEALAGTSTGGTGARLFATPGTIAAAIQGGTYLGATDSAGTDSYAITLVPALTAYATNQFFIVKFGTANTGAATLEVNGLGAKAIKKLHDQDLETGDIEAGSVGLVAYDGTNFQLLSEQASMPTTAILSEMATFFGATDITGAEAETLTGGTSSNASALHTHAISILSGTRAQNAASSTQTFAHGLSTTPKYIEVFVTSKGFDATSAGVMDTITSHGFSDGTVHKAVYTGATNNGASGALPTSGLDTTHCVSMNFDDTDTSDASQIATASFDATNVSLVWTLSGTGTATNMNIVIIAHT